MSGKQSTYNKFAAIRGQESTVLMAAFHKKSDDLFFSSIFLTSTCPVKKSID